MTQMALNGTHSYVCDLSVTSPDQPNKEKSYMLLSETAIKIAFWGRFGTD